MFSMINLFQDPSNQWLNIFLLIFAFLRIFLEVIQLDLTQLPLTQAVFRDDVRAKNFHKMGLIFSLGYIVLFAPATLLS